ncbi:NlpE-like protein [Flavobacterium aquaticum]|uniref:NlpE-like protein n=1 Tax=Flavobacterium aquaticum TaxID=1236486 RepID=A0A327YS32_9FLAO|nr:META domain-containing protein [Flavobacterium aquaticum]RAK22535.1 NlpE-like protein [Flavobacterium aquaticum]
MKKSLLILGIIAIGFTSCKKEIEKETEGTPIDSTVVQVDEHNAKNSLDYQGNYRGNLPCADCESIETTISLTEDSYIKETVYKGKSSKVFKETGKFTWNDAGNTITLSGSAAPNQYFVGENALFHLDVDGKRIEGDLASKYQLSRIEISEPIAPVQKEETKTKEVAKVELKNSKWRLVKLYGKTIEKNKNSNRENGINFNSDGRFSAFAGCNNMMGSYKLKEEVSRIEFSKVASTMMACEDMVTEQELAKVLEMADNYNFDGKTLKLNKARMATLAEFEIIK